jgi:hypothetical protein
MINESVRKNIGLHEVAVHFQRDVMEYNFQVRFAAYIYVV